MNDKSHHFDQTTWKAIKYNQEEHNGYEFIIIYDIGEHHGFDTHVAITAHQPLEIGAPIRITDFNDHYSSANDNEMQPKSSGSLDITDIGTPCVGTNSCGTAQCCGTFSKGVKSINGQTKGDANETFMGCNIKLGRQDYDYQST